MSALGWVCGGPVAVVQALMDVVTPSGTIVMPTHTAEYSEPSHWENPPVPEDWWQTIRDEMPAFDPAITPTRQMGAIAECFRNFPKVYRSNHPASSFAAWGAQAADITQGHSTDFPLGENSPLGELYQRKAHVLLLGATHESNTSLHLSEFRTPGIPKRSNGGPILVNGSRRWCTYDDYEEFSEHFEELGAAFEKENKISVAQIGQTACRLMPMIPLVDFGVEWLTENAPWRLGNAAAPDDGAPTCTIRYLIESDIQKWSELRHQLWSNQSTQSHKQEISEQLRDDSFFAIGAEIHNQVIAFAEVSIRKFANGCDSSPVPFLEGIWVHPDYRRNGIGHQLILSVTRWAGGNGYKELGSDALLQNHESIEAHIGWGFEKTESVQYFRKRFP
jgi:aminoglycoside 3-N-acetyltransferase